MQIETLIGIVASVLTAVAMLPHLVRMLRERTAEKSSRWVALILVAGTGCWVWYGGLKEDLIILISNAFSLSVNATILFLAVRYTK